MCRERVGEGWEGVLINRGSPKMRYLICVKIKELYKKGCLKNPRHLRVRNLWLDSVFVVRFIVKKFIGGVARFMGGFTRFMGVSEIYGSYEIYGVYNPHIRISVSDLFHST